MVFKGRNLQIKNFFDVFELETSANAAYKIVGSGRIAQITYAKQTLLDGATNKQLNDSQEL